MSNLLVWIMLPTLTAYSVFQRNAPTDALPAGTLEVEAEIDYWREKASTITSASELVDDPRLFRFITKAYGYGDSPPATSLVFIALEQGASAADGYANRAPDSRLEEIARQFAFAEFGVTRMRSSGFVTSLANRYRLEAAKQNQPVKTAVPQSQAAVEVEYFKTQIANVESADDLLADFSLYQFTLKSFGLEKDYRNNPFLIKQVLDEGVGDSTDIANRVGDPRLQALARVFGFGEVGTNNVTNPAFGESMGRRYLAAIGELRSETKSTDSEESAYFREHIGSISTAEELVADRRLYTYVMTAFDLGGETDKIAMAKKALDEGVSDRGAFANRLPDPRYRTLARNVALHEFGNRNLQDPTIIDDIVSRYERVNAEVEAGLENPIVETAAYFDRRVSTLSSWLFVVADSRLRQVAATALGMPSSMLALGTDRLIEEFEARFDVTDFADPDKRARFIQRYIAQADAASGSVSSSSNGYLVSLLAGTTQGSGTLYGLVSQL
ncbi:MAG: DUF1217 domain-containing protein [Pseudomonadota bacterium]